MFSPDDAIRAAIPRLRRALDRIGLPADRPRRPIPDLAVEVGELVEHRVQARYAPLAWRAPGVIAELSLVVDGAVGDERRRATALLTLALRAADGIAYKFGYLDLSARIIDVMRTLALAVEDPLLTASVAYVRAETFFANDDLATLLRMLTAAADDVACEAGESAESAAAYGALHMRAAVAAGRAGRHDRAWDHLGEAHRAARYAPDGIYFGTAFGPASVRIHELATAVELADSPAAVERAVAWKPPDSLPAERRSHYYIDLARAQLQLGRQAEVCNGLLLARHAAPEHVRAHPHVRSMLAELLRSKRVPDTGLRELAEWVREGDRWRVSGKQGSEFV